MVYFTCSHCGDAVKKPSVAKHFQWKCRGAPISVSCMDCNKDFHGEEYAAHTTCITEAEKYSGKDHVPKISNNSGQKKQANWTEIVRSILTTKECEVTTAVRCVFQKLEGYDNVPRKKAKFHNFVANCVRIHKDQVEAVWNVLEIALEKFNASCPRATKQVKDAAESTGYGELQETSENNATNDGPIENGTVHVAKRKRKKDKLEADTVEKKSKIAVEAIVSSSEDTKKELRVKSAVTRSDDTEAKTESEVTVTATEKIRKKKRSKIAATEIPDSTQADDVMPKLSEDKALQNGAAPKKVKAFVSQGLTPNPGGVTSTNNFDWTEEIFAILSKYGEIQLDRLRRKIFRRYKSAHQIEDIPWKVQKTFNKKLRKSGLLVQDNVVKIKAN